MTLTNGYKLVYEVITTVDGVSTRTFKASKERYPTALDDIILEREISSDSSELIYEYEGHFYVADGNIPSYGADGVPTDTCISANENFCRVFGLESAAAETEVNETGDPEEAE